MAYTAATSLPDLTLAQWSTPTGPNPRLASPIEAADTTIVFTNTPYYVHPTTGVQTAVTGDCLIGIAGDDGYVETVYCPAGSISGATLTGAVRGVRLGGLDYTTGDSTFAVKHNQDSAVIFNISAIHWKLMVNAFQGNIASGGTTWSVGRGLAEDILFKAFNDHSSKPVFYFDDSDKRWKITRGDDEGAAGESELSGFMRLTTAEAAALTNLPAGGIAYYDTTLGQTRWREGGAWVTNASGGTVADASETVAGKIELATAAEMGAGTSAGATGARLVPPNSALVKTSSGAGDENKIAVLNSSGKFADGFQNITAANATTLTAGPTSDASALHKHYTPTCQAGSGTASGITSSGNLDISVAPFESTDVVKLELGIMLNVVNDDSADASKIAFYQLSGFVGGEYGGWKQENTSATTSLPVVWAANAPEGVGGAWSVSVAAASGTGSTTLTLTAPAWSGNNIRIAYTYTKTGGTGTGLSAANLSVGLTATKLQ